VQNAHLLLVIPRPLQYTALPRRQHVEIIGLIALPNYHRAVREIPRKHRINQGLPLVILQKRK
jgi:hypothetical protein